MEDFLGWLNRLPLRSNLASSLILFLGLTALRYIVVHALNKSIYKNSEYKRKWIVQIRNFTIFLFIIGLLFIWGDELKAFAVSIVAFAVALVIATKELILCFLGGLLKASTNSFEVGDRIEIADYRGDVISQNLLVTTLNEVGPGKYSHQFTGRILSIPNSLFLTECLINETSTGKYVLHTFKIPFRRDEAVSAHHNALKKIMDQHCGDFLKQAKSQFERAARREGLEVPIIEPKLYLAFTDKEQVDLIARIPVPSHSKGKIEQAILGDFWEYYSIHAPKPKKN